MKKALETVSTVQAHAVSAPVDTRRQTTMVGLLEWTYNNERARFATPSTWSPKSGGAHSNADSVRRTLSLGAVIPGSFNGTRAACHEDAERVHDLVAGLERDDYWLIVRAAEAVEVPDWNPHVELGRLHPVMRGDKYKMLYRPYGRQEPIACLAEWIGITPDERDLIREHARQSYSRWWHLVWMLRETLVADDTLQRWQVSGIGAEREPWSNN